MSLSRGGLMEITEVFMSRRGARERRDFPQSDAVGVEFSFFAQKRREVFFRIRRSRGNRKA